MAVQTPPYALQNASHSAALFRQAFAAGIIRSGVFGPSELAVSAQGTPNMSVQVAAGRAAMTGSQLSKPSGQFFSPQGMYFGLNDATITVTLAAADPTNPRIDTVYMAVQDSFYSGSNNVVTIGVVTGTPKASPDIPSPPSNAVSLAQVAVAANATSISSGNITDARQMALIGGGTGLVTQSGSSVVTTNTSGGFAVPFGFAFGAGTPVTTAISGDFNAFEGEVSTNFNDTGQFNGVATRSNGTRVNAATIRVNWIAQGQLVS